MGVIKNDKRIGYYGEVQSGAKDSTHLSVSCHIRVGAVEQEQVLNWVASYLKLRGHLKGHTGTKGIAGNTVRPLRLHLLHALHVIRSHAVNAVQRGSYGEEQDQRAYSSVVKSKQYQTHNP